MSRKTNQYKASTTKFNFGGMFAKKYVKRDINGRKMTQKGAIHGPHWGKQVGRGAWTPTQPTLTNHQRHLLRRAKRQAGKKQEANE